MTTNIPSTDDGEAAQLGAFVREHRDKLGLSQRQLATRARIDNGYVSRMERGRIGAVSQPILRRLANALEVEPEDLYTVSGYVTPQSLPGYSAYLRTKYEMSDDAARELTKFFDDLATRHSIKEREQNQKLSDDNK